MKKNTKFLKKNFKKKFRAKIDLFLISLKLYFIASFSYKYYYYIVICIILLFILSLSYLLRDFS